MSTEAHEPVTSNCGDPASYWKAAHDRVVAQNWELSRQIDALQKVGEQYLRPQQTPTGEGEGWKLVPVEPTEEMQAAGWIDKEDVSPKEIYWAMLNAAPTSPSKSSGEEACQDDEDRRVCYMCDAAISEGEEFHTHPLEGDIHARCCSGEEEGA